MFQPLNPKAPAHQHQTKHRQTLSPGRSAEGVVEGTLRRAGAPAPPGPPLNLENPDREEKTGLILVGITVLYRADGGQGERLERGLKTQLQFHPPSYSVSRSISLTAERFSQPTMKYSLQPHLLLTVTKSDTHTLLHKPAHYSCTCISREYLQQSVPVIPCEQIRLSYLGTLDMNSYNQLSWETAPGHCHSTVTMPSS